VDLPGARDHVKVLDFGVAKLLMSEDVATQVGVVFGTPQYMSPEQGRGEPLTPRSDLYGLGVLAFEMLTGSVPFSDPNPMHVIHMHLQTQVPPLPSPVPGRVQAIVMRALEKDPMRRFASAQEMMDACQSALIALSTGPYSVQSGAVGTPEAFPAGGPLDAAPAGWTGVPSRPGGPPPPAPPLGSPIGPAHAMLTVRAEPVAPAAAAVARAPVTAAPSAKTVMVGSVEQQGQAAAYAADGRTVLLPNSEGLVSMGAGRSPARAARVSGPAVVSATEATASILFWIFCLMAGLAVGVGAYWLVLQLGR
jgi:serine/threonine-protein kinase